MTKRIGLMVGREWSFPPAFIDEVNRRAGLAAELVTIGGVAMEQPCPWDVIVDRISHEVPFYRTYLKQCVLQGTAVVNNPFMWTADDKFFGAALITQLGVASPRTVALPNKDYPPGIVPGESLRNLQYPLDWEGLVQQVGLPCILKDAHGGGWRDVYVCHTLDELIRSYDQSGQLVMIMQEFIRFEQFVRCMCVGQEEILIMPWDPGRRRYGEDPDYLAPALRDRVVRDARTIVRALGYDMNTIEFAIRDGVPYAIDFMNPAPDMDIYSLGPVYFEWVLTRMADLVERLARGGRRQVAELGWSALFTTGRPAGDG